MNAPPTQAPKRDPALGAPGPSTLDVAALSVLEAGGDAEEVSSLVAERALDHCWEGIRQYLAIRAGEERALEILGELEIACCAERDLQSLAGPRATLYGRARAHLGRTTPQLSPSDPRWCSPIPAGTPYAASLVSLRARLTPEQLEVGELCYARGLRAADVAFVVETSIDEVELRLREVAALARRIVGTEPASRSGTLDGALLEAFSLAAAGHRRKSLPLLEPGAVIADRYRIDAHLGTGSFADVYRATDLQVPDHVVALKLFRRLAIHPAARELAMRELRLIASVSHPSVVQFKDYGWHLGRTFFVMPFYRGETLRERLQRAPLGRVEARAIFVPLARALATMHGAGVRHQDIKPENIFLAHPHGEDDDVVPVLIDLGVAAKDAESVLAGTPNYFAPEVAARFAREPDPPLVTGKADVFSLALVLRNALEPEAEEGVIGGAVEAFVRHRARRAPTPPRRRDLAFLRAAFERWLHVAPDSRPSAEELARELTILTAPEERRARTIGLLRWLVPATVAVAVVFAAVVIGLSRENDLQRVEASRARAMAERERTRAQEESQRAAHVREDLRKALEAGRALRGDVERLEEEYRTSRLTRHELASRLAAAEGALAVGAKRHDEDVGELERIRAQREELRVALEAGKASLSREHLHAGELAQRLGETQAELEAARRAHSDARARLVQLEASFSATRVLLAQKPECSLIVGPAAGPGMGPGLLPGPGSGTGRGSSPGTTPARATGTSSHP